MSKVMSGRMVTVIVITLLSVWLCFPTARYFLFEATNSTTAEGMTEEQIEAVKERRYEMLTESNNITFGLDLQGGVEMVFELNEEAMILRDLDKFSDNLREEFDKEDVNAVVIVDRDNQNILIESVAKPDVKIAKDLIEDFEGFLAWDTLSGLDTNGSVTLRVATESINRAEAIDATIKTFEQRIGTLSQATIQKQPPNRVLVQIPGEANPEAVEERLLAAGSLQFHLLHPEHDQLIQEFLKPGTFGRGGTGIIKDEFLTEVESSLKVGEMVTQIDRRKVLPMLPPGYMLFLGVDKEINPDGSEDLRENLVYMLRERPAITGENLRRSDPYVNLSDLSNPNQVLLEFDPEGREKFAELTKDNLGEPFAMMLDNVVRSAPVIQAVILDGTTVITGGFSLEEATDLALTLKSGALSAPLKIVSSAIIGPELGRDSVVGSGYALIVGAILLIIMLIVVYRVAGFMAVGAMILNVTAILGILSMMDATLTLSGIGGILLTMGMAVDANVLIYERLREELKDGKPFRAALSAAFGRAFTVILDSNITTLLPALVLILFEVVEGSVRGFWFALAIGLIVNLYTGLTVTRALIEGYAAKFDVQDPKKFVGKGISFFEDINFDFMKYRKYGFPISAVLLTVSLGYLVIHGVNPGIDFTGGVRATVEIAAGETVERSEIEQTLSNESAGGFADVKVVNILNQPRYNVTVPVRNDDMTLEAVEEKIGALIASSDFGDKLTIVQTQSVDSSIGEEFKWTAFFTVLVASLVILGYIAIRFKPIFGLGAVAALVHDLLITLGIFVLLGGSVTLDVVSALLIILGYSVNDTIVVFDRIRETQNQLYGRSMGEIINLSINRTLSRTVFTSGTTLVAVLSMLILGGIGLKDFSTILLLGIIAGTYSSIFVASALVYQYITAKEKTQGIQKAQGQTKRVKIG